MEGGHQRGDVEWNDESLLCGPVGFTEHPVHRTSQGSKWEGGKADIGATSIGATA